VYVIIRVYNLEKKTIPDFAVYVDPWALYLARKLEFWASENYLVTRTELGNQSGLI
jgi:hypothetical protein